MKSSINVSAVALCAFAGIAAAQPANDLCANAQEITGAGVIQGRTTAATNDGTTQFCGAATSPDVWYSYTATAANAGQSIILDTCASTSGLDTVITAFTGSCSGPQLSCNDNSTGCGTGTQSRLTIPLTVGQTYIIRVAGKNGTTGAFVLTVGITVPPPGPNSGPDIIVGDVSDAASYGAVGSISAYAYGTTSCNAGDANVDWIANNNRHPVIGQNLYRLKDGRFEMIGASWLKHGFTALTQNLCSTCSGQGGVVLGVGCSDPYVASLNGDQSRLGPRSHVNATTGHYPYPFTTPGAGYMVPPAAAAVIGRRLQVQTADVAAAQNAGARYFAECQYITSDEARFVAPSTGQARNGLNNLSWRETRFTGAANTASMVGSTVRQQSALMAWRVVDPTVTVQSFDYVDPITVNSVLINFVARYYVATKVTDNGNGTWTYRYVVENLNSDRNAGAFSLPTVRATTTDTYYRGVTYHSGESVDMNAPWVFNSGSGINWATPQTFAQNPNSSAIRWSTASTFEVTTNTAPTTGNATLSFFKPAAGQPDTLTLAGLTIPSDGACPSDFNDDGIVDFFDYLDFVAAFSSGDMSADFNGNATLDFFDYLDYVEAFSTGC